MSVLIGTGMDPDGRWPKDVVIEPDATKSETANEVEREALVAQGFAKEVKKAPAAPDVHVPARDVRGVLRTDRQFTPDEALAIDKTNREHALTARQHRFHRGRR